MCEWFFLLVRSRLLRSPIFPLPVDSIRHGHEISVVPPKLKVAWDIPVFFCNAVNIFMTCSCIFVGFTVGIFPENVDISVSLWIQLVYIPPTRASVQSWRQFVSTWIAGGIFRVIAMRPLTSSGVKHPHFLFIVGSWRSWRKAFPYRISFTVRLRYCCVSPSSKVLHFWPCVEQLLFYKSGFITCAARVHCPSSMVVLV